MTRLRIIGDDGSERMVDLHDRKVQIGRGRDNDIVLPDPEKGVSRTHAELRFENGRYVIVDLQSQNGTWLDGQRVERAEVPPDSEIAVGGYRLRLQTDPAPEGGDTSIRHARDPIEDIEIRERPTSQTSLRRRATDRPPPAPRGWFPGAAVGAAIVMLVAVVVWVWAPVPRRIRVTPAPQAAEPGSSPQAPATPAPDATPPPAVADPAPAAGTARRADAADSPAGSNAASKRAAPAKPAPEWIKAGLEVGDASDPARVARKPGESLEIWRIRGAALQMRYAYSKAALDRRDFAAAAGGFEAILMEEPGFLDAPQLLVRAHAGLRVNARDLYEAGNRLDAVGDWVGALQKYDQARQISPGVPGMAAAVKRVREKLRLAGYKALNQAWQHDAAGRSADALKEYEKALQWLPDDDPNREIARARVDQLRRND